MYITKIFYFFDHLLGVVLCVEIGGTGLLAGIEQRQAILDAVRELVVDRIQGKTLEMSKQQVTLSESENRTRQNIIDDCVYFFVQPSQNAPK